MCSGGKGTNTFLICIMHTCSSVSQEAQMINGDQGSEEKRLQKKRRDSHSDQVHFKWCLCRLTCLALHVRLSLFESGLSREMWLLRKTVQCRKFSLSVASPRALDLVQCKAEPTFVILSRFMSIVFFTPPPPSCLPGSDARLPTGITASVALAGRRPSSAKWAKTYCCRLHHPDPLRASPSTSSSPFLKTTSRHAVLHRSSSYQLLQLSGIIGILLQFQADSLHISAKKQARLLR